MSTVTYTGLDIQPVMQLAYGNEQNEEEDELAIADSGLIVFKDTRRPLAPPLAESGADQLKALDTLRLLEEDGPELEPLIGGFIGLPQGEVVSFTGDSGTGKSWLALDMLVSVALKRPFLGQPTRQASGLYLDFEQSLTRGKYRIKKVLRGHGVAIADVVQSLGYKNLTAYSGTLLELEDVVRGYIAEINPGFIVIDGFEAAFAIDSNAGHEVVKAYALLKRLTRDGRTVMVLEHPSRAGRSKAAQNMEASGSVQKRAQVRVGLGLKATTTPNVLHFAVAKANDGKETTQQIQRLGQLEDDWLRHELYTKVRVATQDETPASTPLNIDTFTSAVEAIRRRGGDVPTSQRKWAAAIAKELGSVKCSGVKSFLNRNNELKKIL